MIFKKHPHDAPLCKRVRILAWLSVIGWSLLIAALVVFHYGRPEKHFGILRYFDIEVRHHWYQSLLVWYVILLLGCALVSLLSLYVNRTRVKNHPQRTWYNLVLLLLISLVMLLGVL